MARAGAFIGDTRLAPRVIFGICATFMLMNPPRRDFLMREYDLSSQTVVSWYSFIREVSIDHLFKSSADKLGGSGKIVEIDEAKFGHRKYNRSRVVDGQWVFGRIERGTGKSFFVPVDTRDADTLLRIIRERIEPGTTIVSDCWKAYRSLEEAGFEHLTVNHSIEFIDAHTGAHIERQWRDVYKRQF